MRVLLCVCARCARCWGRGVAARAQNARMKEGNKRGEERESSSAPLVFNRQFAGGSPVAPQRAAVVPTLAPAPGSPHCTQHMASPSPALAAAAALGLPVSPAWAEAALTAKAGGGCGDARPALLAAFLTADLNACGGDGGGGVARLPADLTVRVCVWEGEGERGCLLHLVFSRTRTLNLSPIFSTHSPTTAAPSRAGSCCRWTRPLTRRPPQKPGARRAAALEAAC